MLFNVVNYQYLPWFAVKCRYILEARELQILSMVDRIYRQLMTRHYNKQLESDKWQGDVCPKIRKKVEKVTEFANTCYVEGSGDGLFLVGDRGHDYIVDMHKKTCTCRRIQKGGVPCSHVIACCRNDRIDPLTMVDPCYSKEMFKKAYGNIIYPCKDRREWEDLHGPPIEPPLYQKHVGRPCTTRRQAPGEVDHRRGGKKITRHGVIMHCSYCGEEDHNKKGCKYLKAGLPPPNVPPPNDQPSSNVPPPNEGNAGVNVTPPNEGVVGANVTPTNVAPPYGDLMVDNMIAQVLLISSSNVHSLYMNILLFSSNVHSS